jgi:hypothetical protein
MNWRANWPDPIDRGKADHGPVASVIHTGASGHAIMTLMAALPGLLSPAHHFLPKRNIARTTTRAFRRSFSSRAGFHSRAFRPGHDHSPTPFSPRKDLTLTTPKRLLSNVASSRIDALIGSAHAPQG